MEIEISNSVRRFIVAYGWQFSEFTLENGVVSLRDPFNFSGPNYIPETADARVVSGVVVGYIKW